MRQISYILIIIVLLFVLALLFVVERKLKNKLRARAGQNRNPWLTALGKIRAAHDSPQITLNKLDRLFKSYITAHMHVKKPIEYSTLVELLRSKKKDNLRLIANKILTAYYKEETVSAAEIQAIMRLLEQVMKKQTSVRRRVYSERHKSFPNKSTTN